MFGEVKIIVFLAKHGSFICLCVNSDVTDTFTYCTNSSSVECTSGDFSCVYSEIMFTII